MQDKITALAVPPGNSLTDAPGKWAWEQPARFPDPDDAIDFAINTIANGPAREDMIKMMMAGITVQELVDQISFKGFMAGAFTPDTAELIKPALGIFLADMAIQEGFEPQMFVDEEEPSSEFSDKAFFTVMKNRNPELFSAMVEELNEMQRTGAEEDANFDAAAMQQQQDQQQLRNNSFLMTEEN